MRKRYVTPAMTKRYGKKSDLSIGVLRGKIRAGDPVLKIHFHIFGFYGMA